MAPLHGMRLVKSISPVFKMNTLKMSSSLYAIQAIAKRSFTITPPSPPKDFFLRKDIGILIKPNPITGKNIIQKFRPGIAFIVTAEKVIWIFLSSMKPSRKNSGDIIIPKDEDNHLHSDSRVMIKQVITTSRNDPLFSKIGALNNSNIDQSIAKAFLQQIALKTDLTSHQGDIVQVKTAEGLSFKAVIISNEERGFSTALVAKIVDKKNTNSSSLLSASFATSQESELQSIIIDMHDLHSVSIETMTQIGKLKDETIKIIYQDIEKLSK